MTRSVPRESLKSLRQVTKRLTLLLAGDLAKEVAAIFREVYTHPSKQLYDDTTVHLLCSNYWLQPIYQDCCARRRDIMPLYPVNERGHVVVLKE